MSEKTDERDLMYDLGIALNKISFFGIVTLAEIEVLNAYIDHRINLKLMEAGILQKGDSNDLRGEGEEEKQALYLGG